MKPRRASSLHDRISALRALREVEFFNWSEKIEHRVFFKRIKIDSNRFQKIGLLESLLEKRHLELELSSCMEV